MADITVTASQVLLVSGPTIDGTAGAAITPGQSVYLDTSTNTWKLAQADGTAAEAGSGGYGIALNGASAASQPIKVAGPGCIVTIGAGAAPASGTVYVVSATAGGIAPTADVTTSAYYRSILGVGAGTNRIAVVAATPYAIP